MTITEGSSTSSSSSSTSSSSSSSDYDYTGPPARKKFAIDPDAAAVAAAAAAAAAASTPNVTHHHHHSHHQQQHLHHPATTAAALSGGTIAAAAVGSSASIHHPNINGGVGGNIGAGGLGTSALPPMANGGGGVGMGGSSTSSAAEISAGATKLAQELNDFVRAQQQAQQILETHHPSAIGSMMTSLSSVAATTTASAAAVASKLTTPHLPDEAIMELQLATCRKLRELLPTNKELLHVAQERNWIPLILSWLNLHDRPAVQVEALLALTNIAELCAQQSSYFQHHNPHSSNAAAQAAAAQQAAQAAAVHAQTSSAVAAAAAQAAVSAVKGGTIPGSASATSQLAAAAAAQSSSATTPSFQEAMEAVNSKYAPSKYPYPGLVSPAPGSVPFPPLSFSQTLSPEAVAAFDASLASTVQTTTSAAGLTTTSDVGLGKDKSRLAQSTSSLSDPGSPLSAASTTKASNLSSATNPKSWTMPPAPWPPLPGNFPSTTPATTTSASTAPTGGINFTSLAPPPGGAHSSVPSNAFLPPPTPVAIPSGGLSFPQQLSASSQHLLLRHADAIPTLISLLSSPNREVYEQAMWILGSIAAGDSPGGAGAAAGTGTSSGSGSSSNSSSSLDGRDNKSVSARDVILAAGVMNQLLRCLETHPTNLSLQRIGSWTLSNLVDGIFQSSSSHAKNGGSGNKSSSTSSSGSSDYSSADEIEMQTLLPVLRRLLRMTDSEVLSYTCWTLSHLCDGPSSHIAVVVTSSARDPTSGAKGGLVPRLVELLMHPSWRVTKPALRTIGNIVCAECSDDTHNSSGNSGGGSGGGSTTNTTDYTEVILECDAVPRLKELVTHSNREIQKEACWTLSNIAAGTIDQIQAVIDSGAIAPLVKLVRDKATDQEVRSEACWVVLNATSCGSDSQIEVLVDEGCVSVLGVLLSEASMVMMALEGLERVLQVEETREMIRREQIENGDYEDDEENRTPTLVSAALIEKARESHNSSSVTKRADRIWKQHFVSCALCRQSFSKHRTSDASFCEECKCYVCSNCNCKIYHLDYQEELWAATEEKTEAKETARKRKNKKKKERHKQKKANKQQQEPEMLDGTTGVSNGSGDDQGDSNHRRDTIAEEKKTVADASASSMIEDNNRSTGSGDTADLGSKKVDGSAAADRSGDTGAVRQSKKNDEETANPTVAPTPAATPAFYDEEDGDEDDSQNQIDFVLYLQQTGSIIALAKLMDALEYGGEDYDEELDDYERKMIREQQLMRNASAGSVGLHQQ